MYAFFMVYKCIANSTHIYKPLISVNAHALYFSNYFVGLIAQCTTAVAKQISKVTRQQKLLHFPVQLYIADKCMPLMQDLNINNEVYKHMNSDLHTSIRCSSL